MQFVPIKPHDAINQPLQNKFTSISIKDKSVACSISLFVNNCLYPSGHWFHHLFQFLSIKVWACVSQNLLRSFITHCLWVRLWVDLSYLSFHSLPDKFYCWSISVWWVVVVAVLQCFFLWGIFRFSGHHEREHSRAGIQSHHLHTFSTHSPHMEIL